MKVPHLSRAAAIGAALLCGCHSLPALHYYALDTVRPAAAVRPPQDSLLIHVRHVGVPHEMDHLGLTHHLGPTQLAISDNDQWTAPLSILIQGTITQDLGERLGYAHVVAIDAPSMPARASTQTALDLDFVSLLAGDTCGITAQVNWAASSANGTSRRGTVQLSAPGTTCPSGLPAALSAALGDLADQLAVQLTGP